jgi:hypothetical protein
MPWSTVTGFYLSIYRDAQARAGRSRAIPSTLGQI